MEEKLTQVINFAPTLVWLSVIALFGLGVGFLFARKIWGKNNKRLKATLEDSSYLAGQWATMGLSQSQLVEKLGDKVVNSLNEFSAKESALRAEILNQRNHAEQARDELKRLSDSGLLMSEREAESLKLQTDEVKKRDQRIKTLEARLEYLDTQSDQEVAGHQEQVKVLLERIAVLEAQGAPESELAENNRRLTELLKERCSELETLRDEFYTKHKDLVYLKQQNASLKKSVDEVIAGWSKKKGDNAAYAKSKLRLAEVETELKQVREAFDGQSLELEILKSKSELGSVSSFEGSPEDAENAVAQIDILLEIVENRDKRVAELERQIGAGSNGDQIVALTQTIADLQTRVTESERRSAEDANSASVTEQFLSAANSNRVAPKTEPANRSSSNPRHTLKKPGIKELFYFAKGETNIRQDESSDLDVLAKEILLTDCQVSVVGFSGDEGDQSLSLQRAELIRERLVDKGVDSSQVIVRDRGQDRSFANSSESWKASRVEIVLLPIAEIVN